jgi:hypothetical protein
VASWSHLAGPCLWQWLHLGDKGGLQLLPLQEQEDRIYMDPVRCLTTETVDKSPRRGPRGLEGEDDTENGESQGGAEILALMEDKN